MDVYLNLWGGEGYLTARAMLALASIGVYDDLVDTADHSEVKILYGCYDFTGLANADKMICDNMYEAYTKYYCGIIRNRIGSASHDTHVVRVGTTINSMVHAAASMKLNAKYDGSREFLAFGCDKADMDTDLTHGIYGKPWVGEAYYADSEFSPIYTEAAGKSIVIINCGGYKGGGTAATFIPLENSFAPVGVVKCERFNVIVGPSTQFNRLVKYPNPGIYTNTKYDKGVDLFNIPDAIDDLSHMVKNAAHVAKHNENVAFLESQYRNVYYPDAPGGAVDRRSLNPVNYMPRFVDRVESDKTMEQVRANFINLKPNLKSDTDGNFEYDVTSDRFQPDAQLHKLHITNLVSAIEIQEIATNHSDPLYRDQLGSIFVFQYGAADKFTLDGVFRPDDVNKVLHFIIFSMLITDYAYNCFNNITNTGLGVMLDKWAITEGWGHRVAADDTTDNGALNFLFANKAREILINLAHEYIKPTLEVLLDVNDTCSDVELFSKTKVGNVGDLDNGIYGIVKGIVDKIQTNDNGTRSIQPIKEAAVIQANSEKSIAALIMGRFDQPNDFSTCLHFIRHMNGEMGFLTYYQNAFPKFGQIQGFPRNRQWNKDIKTTNVAEYAAKYCEDIIRTTYEIVRDTFTSKGGK